MFRLLLLFELFLKYHYHEEFIMISPIFINPSHIMRFNQQMSQGGPMSYVFSNATWGSPKEMVKMVPTRKSWRHHLNLKPGPSNIMVNAPTTKLLDLDNEEAEISLFSNIWCSFWHKNKVFGVQKTFGWIHILLVGYVHDMKLVLLLSQSWSSS